MTKVLPILALLFLLFYNSGSAQKRTITGTVSSTTEKSGLASVSVMVKGDKKGTNTKENGTFQITTDKPDPVLVFSIIGFENEEIPVGSESELMVQLSESVNQLEGVVVSALGFKEKADKVATTSSRVTGAALVNSGEPGVINALAGKASGVQINRNGGDPGAGSFIQIRGLNTLTGNNQPLIIIDGIPVSNSSVGGTTAGVLQQSRLNDINPNDIASMQVLKGASAAAVWGSRAANGVIIITTKKGSKDRLSISFNSSVSVDNVNRFHEKQSTFGQGTNGIYSPTATNSWGDKIASRSGATDDVNTTGAFFEAVSGRRYYPIIKKNSTEVFNQSNYDQVFGTGLGLDNALSISGGNEKSTFYFSVGNLNQKGVLKGNSDYHRTTFKANTERRFGSVFRISTNSALTLINSERAGRSNNISGPIATTLRNAPDFDITDYKGSYYASAAASPILNRQRNYRNYLGASQNPTLGNPLWALYEQEYTSNVNRFVNSVEAVLKPVKWFDLTARGGYDFYTDQRLDYLPVNDLANSGNGQFTETMIREAVWTTDLIGRVSKDFSDNFSVNYILGFSVNNQNFYSNATTVRNFIIPDAPANFSNATNANISPVNLRTKVRNARLYNTAGITLYDAIFVNLSAAAETGSAFGEKSNKTFYYPSADIAWQFSKLKLFETFSALSFGKLRASYGVVGVQPLPYRTQTSFVSASYNQGVLGDQLTGAQYGNGAFIQNSEQGNEELRPERKTEYELGADLRFFKNKVRAGFTFYKNTVKDMLIPVSLPASTGFASKYTNAASLENKGLEVDLSMDVLTTKNFKWAINSNFSRVRNMVIDLAGTSLITVVSDNTATIVPSAVVGQPVGVFWAGKYERTKDGALALDANNFPKLDRNLGVVGDPNPKWGGGLGTSITYKKFALEVLFETSQGQDLYEGTRGVMYNFGTHADVGNEVTLTQDVKNYVGKVFKAGTTVRGNLNDFGGGVVLLDEPYYTSIGGGFSSLKDHIISDGSWTRLRQLSLSYRFDSDRFRKKIPFQSVEISAAGRNLFLWTKIKGVDPDTNLSGTLLARGQDYFNTPNTRSFIFSLKINY